MKRLMLYLALVAVVLVPDFAHADKGSKKDLEAKAKTLVNEGKSLKKQGRLLEAKEKVAEAEGIAETNEGKRAAAEINNEIAKTVKKSLEEGNHLYGSAKYKEALAALMKAALLEPSNPSLQYDIALCELKLADRQKAIEALNLAIHGMANPKEKEKITELRDSIATNEAPPSLKEADKESVKKANALVFSLRDATWKDKFTASEETAPPPDVDAQEGSTKQIEVKAPVERSTTSQPTAELLSTSVKASSKNDTPSAPGNPQTMLCKQLHDLRDSLPRSPAVYFNLARCAELEGNTDESVKLFSRYLELAPGATDDDDIKLKIEDLTSLAHVSGLKGAEVRKLYADASKELDAGRYDLALADYKKAETLAPDFPQTQRRLALMYEMRGNVQLANKYFVQYRDLVPSPTDKADAESHISSLASKKEQYDASVGKARELLSDLLYKWIGLSGQGVRIDQTVRVNAYYPSGGEQMAYDYCQLQLDKVSKQLQIAQSTFPLAPEVNELLGVTFLLGHNGRAAQRHFDAVVTVKLPVFFYAGLIDSKDKKHQHLVKCELDHDLVRLIYLASYDPKSKQYKSPSIDPGPDHLGDLITTKTIATEKFDGLTLKTADLKQVETKYSYVDMKLQDRELWLAPVNMVGATPLQGPPARKFANDYTRLFRDYLGIEDAKLGKESMTTGEKVQIGIAIAGMGAGAAGAAGLMGASMGTFSSTFVTMSMTTFQASSAYLQASSREERDMLEMDNYKLIPSEPFQLTFREDLK